MRRTKSADPSPRAWAALALSAGLVACATACSASGDAVTDAGLDAAVVADAAVGADSGATSADAGSELDAAARPDAAPTSDAGPDAGAPADAGGQGVTAAELARVLSTCQLLAGSTKFAPDDGEASTIDVCTLQGARWWSADMDIDCDGGRTASCRADPAYLPETSIEDSTGQPVDAAAVPFVVVPLPSNGFDYAAEGIHLGAAVVVLYHGQLQYGVFADEGPEGIIGEASYAMAVLFGVDPDPIHGGADDHATYVVFTGRDAVLTRAEDHAEAIQLGERRARQLLLDN